MALGLKTLWNATWSWSHHVALAAWGGGWRGVGMYRHDFISGVTLFNVNWENEAGCIAMLVSTRGLDRNFKTLVFLPWNIIQLSFHMRAFGSPPSAEWQVVRSSLSLPTHPQWLGQSNWASPNHVNRPTTCAWPTHYFCLSGLTWCNLCFFSPTSNLRLNSMCCLLWFEIAHFWSHFAVKFHIENPAYVRYNAAISACHWPRAVALLRQGIFGVAPNVLTYSALVERMAGYTQRHTEVMCWHLKQPPRSCYGRWYDGWDCFIYNDFLHKTKMGSMLLFRW